MRKDELPALGKALGWNFKGCTNPESRCVKWYAFTHPEHPGTMDIKFPDSEDKYGFSPGRIVVNGSLPRVEGHDYYDRESVSITIDPARPLEAIAKDIQRRFLPGWLAKVAKFKEWKDSALKYDREEAEVVSRIKGALKGLTLRPYGMERPHETRYTLEGGGLVHLDLKPRQLWESGDEPRPWGLEMKIELPADLAIDVLSLIAEHCRQVKIPLKP